MLLAARTPGALPAGGDERARDLVADLELGDPRDAFLRHDREDSFLHLGPYFNGDIFGAGQFPRGQGDPEQVGDGFVVHELRNIFQWDGKLVFLAGHVL